MIATYIDHMGDDLRAVNAARTSFNKTSSLDKEGELREKDKRLISFLCREEHYAPFEHLVATFHLKVPIFIARQIHRHRTFSYSEISRRYVDYEPEFFWPEKWRKKAENVKQGSSNEEVEDEDWAYGLPSAIGDFGNQAVWLYNDMLDSGVAPELARMILPQNMYTEFYMTGNLRNWTHFLKLRLDSHAQEEVRAIAAPIRDKLRELFPESMQALFPDD